jgi:hypothetical protein
VNETLRNVAGVVPGFPQQNVGNQDGRRNRFPSNGDKTSQRDAMNMQRQVMSKSGKSK